MIESAVEWAFQWWGNRKWSATDGEEMFREWGPHVWRLTLKNGKAEVEINKPNPKARTGKLQGFMDYVAEAAPDLEVTAYYGVAETGKVHPTVPIIVGGGPTGSQNVIGPNMHFLGEKIEAARLETRSGPPWGMRVAKAVLRACVPLEPRVRLAELSLEHPEVLDAKIARRETKMPKYTKATGFEFPDHLCAPMMSMGDQLAYRYQVGCIGWRADWWKLQSGSLWIECSPWKHWLYGFLQEGVDYIRAETLEQVPEVVWMARDHDDECCELAESAQRKIGEVNYQTAVEYMALLLRRLRELQA